jgi:hypothetical protein
MNIQIDASRSLDNYIVSPFVKLQLKSSDDSAFINDRYPLKYYSVTPQAQGLTAADVSAFKLLRKLNSETPEA